MVIAQELIGRPYIEIFGIKATTIVWILIAIMLGLIWTMTAYPGWWRQFFSKNKDKRQKFFADWYRRKAWVLVLIVMVSMLLCYLAGTVVGFDTAMNTFMEKGGCEKISCSDLYPAVDCSYCECSLCGDSVNIEIPVKR